VPYYLCDNGKINTDGEGLFDDRFVVDECDTFEDCCLIGDIQAESTQVPSKAVDEDS
jgi:hypothetical protein